MYLWNLQRGGKRICLVAAAFATAGFGILKAALMLDHDRSLLAAVAPMLVIMPVILAWYAWRFVVAARVMRADSTLGREKFSSAWRATCMSGAAIWFAVALLAR